MSGFNKNQLEELGGDGRVERVQRRAIVPLDGPTVMIVMDGWFRVFRNAAFVRDVTLFLAKSGDVLAPSALFGERSAESGAQAIADSSMLAISREAFERHANADPGLYVRIAQNLGRRVTRVQMKLEAFSRSTVEARVAGALLEIADDFGLAGAAGTRLELPLSQEDLANLAGTTRESCSQAVAAFARRGFVKGSRLRGLTITDRAALAALLP
ncbi:MAG: hypothetical protein NVSMB64_27250 [Candidatus Velthaea sp.]